MNTLNQNSGSHDCFIEINNYQFLIFICEDMWHSSTHKIDPVMKALSQYKENYAVVGLIRSNS